MPANEHQYEQMWQVHGYSMLSMDLGVTYPFSTTKRWLCSFVDKNWHFTFERNVGSMYYSVQEMALAATWGKRDFLEPAWLRAYMRTARSLYGKAQKLPRTLTGTKLARLNDEELYLAVRRAGLLLSDVYAYFNTCQPQCVVGLERDLETALSRSVPAPDVRDVLLELTHPVEKTFAQEEEFAWLTLCAQEDREAALKLVGRHARDYGILGTSDGGAFLDAAHYQALFMATDPAAARGRLAQLAIQAESIVECKHARTAAFGLDAFTLRLARILEEAGHVRFELRLRGWMPLDYWFTAILLPHLAARKGIEVALLRQMTFEELLQYLLTGTHDPAVLRERDAFFIVGMRDGAVFHAQGADGQALSAKLVRQEVLDETELRGQIAYKGVVRGTAFVFHWDTDDATSAIASMPDGAILVAGQTRPQLLPALRRASAIVTDEGGITSHAAIVARELTKPCVIGTKRATKVFRTGDEIEVDAVQGIVRKITKHS